MIKSDKNFIPDTVNPSPDYYCTWQTQLYATSDGKPEGQRRIIGEKALFDNKKPYGWAYFYENAKRDLFIVMDDSWDVPPNGNSDFYGSLILDKEKFPSFYENGETPQEAMKKLCDKIKSLGWKGLGGWVCAQECEMEKNKPTEDYWIERLKWADFSKMSYWKVDWGKKAGDVEFRKMLTSLARKYAPDLIVENAFNPDFISFSDTFRTYDVPAIMSIPMTMEKLSNILKTAKASNEAMCLVNCEDEAYIAASGGFTMGIMRHPYADEFPNGNDDMSFPECHRNLKLRTSEVARAARWHRVAPAFAADSKNVFLSDTFLTDTWKLEKTESEIENWWLSMDSIKDFITDGVISKSACSAISRNMPLPIVVPDKCGIIPYTVCSKNPNGVVSVATCGRTIQRDYFIPQCNVEIEIGNADTIGAFGEYKNLILDTAFKTGEVSVYAQDILDDSSYNITGEISHDGNKITIPGKLIHKIGTLCQSCDDISEPGMMIKIIKGGKCQ